MTAIKAYDISMRPELEMCFKTCVEALGWEYRPDGRHADLVNIEEAYMRRGCFWCLFEGDKLIGMAAAHGIDDENKIAEMKRLYVLPEYQGKGYGGMLFGHALKYAKEQGYKALRLDTRRDRSAVLHLADKYRFRRAERYNDNEYAELFYELELSE